MSDKLDVWRGMDGTRKVTFVTLVVTAISLPVFVLAILNPKLPLFSRASTPATPPTPPEVVDYCQDFPNNLISNYNFESGKRDWKYYEPKSGWYRVVDDNHSCKKAVNIKLKRKSKSQLYQAKLTLKPNTTYEFSFEAKTTRAQSIDVFLHKHKKPYTNYGLAYQAQLTPDWQTFTTTFTTPSQIDKNARLRFWFNGLKGDEYFLDNAILREKVVVEPTPPVGNTLDKKVYVLIFDPVLETKGGMKLSEYAGWEPYMIQTQKAIDFFDQASAGYMQFEIARVEEFENRWPTKIDGFTYTEQQYLDVIENNQPPHHPDNADYYQFLNDPQLDICGSFNRGEIDELWLFAGPWFGFYESAMASNPSSPGFYVNGPTFTQTSCAKLLPVGIPGPHTFGHRAEATMAYVYGDWQQNRQDTRWDMFGLERAHSPDFNSFGCGSVHYAPNSMTTDDGYRFDLPYSATSYCDAFTDLPDVELSSLGNYEKQISCSEWGCSTQGYELWWWEHIPKFEGVGVDGKLNNWWDYIFDLNNSIPVPRSGIFSNMRALFPHDSDAIFEFDYTGNDPPYIVDVSTFSDMSWDVYLSFAQGFSSPITETNPRKWDKYSCGSTLYWRVRTTTGGLSDIVTTQVSCE